MDETGRSSIVQTMSAGLRVAPVVVFVILTLCIIALILVFIVYRVRRTELQATRIISKPTTTKAETTVDDTKLPSSVNGQEFSYTFWLYVVQHQTTAKPQIIFRRGGSSTDWNRCNFLAVMKHNENKMYICASTNGGSDLDAPTKLYDENNGRFLVATVDYVPLQRWVNFTVVVNNNMISVFQDGSIYTVQHLESMRIGQEGARPVFTKESGSVTAGGGTAGSALDAPNAFVANMYYFNYALAQDDVNAIYAKGPVPWSSRFLSLIGIPEYGLRSPIYRLDSVDYSVDLDD